MADRGVAAEIAAWVRARDWVTDAALVAAVTIVAAAFRLWALGDVPFGVHPDEAQIGLDARRIIDEGWIGVYSHAALGVPTFNAYVTAPFVWILGSTALSMRVGLALVGLAAVPLAYALVRILYGRTEATFAALLLAVSYWHVFYSRVAHSSISYPTVFLGALVCIAMGVRTGRAGWWVAGGGLLGFGVYAYNVAPIVLVATGAWFGLMWLVWWQHAPDGDRAVNAEPSRPRTGQAPALRSDDGVGAMWTSGVTRDGWLWRVLICFGAAAVVALPFIIYIANPDAFYWTHIEDYSHVSITRSDQFQDASVIRKLRIMGEQVRDFAATYAWNGREDLIDGMGTRAVFDPLVLVLLGIGAVMAIRRWREPMVLLAAACMVIIPLPALTQTESMMRQPIAAAPFAMFVAALPLAALWRIALRSEGPRRVAIGGLAAACVAIVGAVTVRDYFVRWDGSALQRYVYHDEITAAAMYMDDLPDGSFVYLYSDRHPLYLETVTYLAPDVVGEDRSEEFSSAAGSIERLDDSNGVAVLLDSYLGLARDIETRYPGGVEHRVFKDGDLMFIAYELGAARVSR